MAKHLHLSGKTSAYEYRPLGQSQIRLLELFSGPRDARLRGTLRAVDLPFAIQSADDKRKPVPHYDALSYHWGDPDPAHKHTINLLEDDEWYHIEIRPNLASALRRLRHLHDPRLLWVDALCINQKPDKTDMDERKIYVPRMDVVYNKAKCVCIWLGEEAEDSKAAMAFANQIQDFNPIDGFVKDAGGAQSLASFAALLRRPWFNRRWIVQELAVARKAQMYCGDAEVPWRIFSGAISLLISKHVDLRQIFRSSSAFNHNPDYLGAIEQLGAVQLVYAEANCFRKSADGDILCFRQSLEDLVSRLTTFEAQDPRDIIYAVLSLSNDAIKRPWTKNPSLECDSDPFNAKHTRSFSVPELHEPQEHSFIDIDIKYQSSPFEVYKDFLKLAISNSESIDIICRPWAAEDPDSEDGYPSWIPMRTGAPFGLRSNRAYSRVRADLLVGTLRKDQKLHRASGDQKAQWDYRDYTPLNRSLVVRGFVLDSVNNKLTPAMGGVVPAEWPSAWEALPKEKRPPGSFWRTLVADCSAEGKKPAPFYYSRAYDYAFEQRVTGADFDTREMIKDIHCPTEVQEYLERVQAITWRRRFFVSKERKLIGLVPFETKKRDLICIVAGCSVPVVLRQLETKAAFEKYRHSMAEEEKASTPEEKPSDGKKPTDGSRSVDDAVPRKVLEQLDGSDMVEGRSKDHLNMQCKVPDQVKSHGTTDLSGLPKYYYQFIGECYIHGMMDGEAIALMKPGGTKEEYNPQPGAEQAFWLR